MPVLFDAAIKPRIRETAPAACNNTRKCACSHFWSSSTLHCCRLQLLQTITMPRNNIAMHVHHKWCQQVVSTHAQTCILQNLAPQMLPIRYAGRHANFWQQNIGSKQCKRSSASLPKVCCAHMNEVAAFISGTTRGTEALFQNVSGQLTLSKEGGVGDAGQGLV